MSELKMHDIGAKCTIAKSVEATVIGISITATKGVQYNCLWWHNGDRKTEWLNSFECVFENGKKLSIGFNSAST